MFFVDDLTLFARANKKNYGTILASLKEFNVASGQKVNFQKSKVNFSTNCKDYWANLCSSLLGMKIDTVFSKYLGFPVFYKRPTNSDFQFILHNLHTKLTYWKTKFLNMDGTLHW